MDQVTYSRIPVLPLRDNVLFPGTALPLSVGRSKSVAAIKVAQDGDSRILIVAQKEARAGSDVRAADLYHFGTICKIEKMRNEGAEGYRVLVRGLSRFKIFDYSETNGLITAAGEIRKDELEGDARTGELLLDGLKAMSKDILQLIPGDTTELTELVEGITDLSYLTNLCTANIEIPLARKQELLETASVKSRALALMDLMQQLKEKLTVQGEIREKLGQKMGKQQREVILREQLKAIHEELGDAGSSDKNDDYRKKIEAAGMPEEARKVALEELARLDATGGTSPETHVIRTYLDLMCALPWSKSADQVDIDLAKAREILDRDHSGLPKIKTRIVQHLAVMKLRKTGKGSLLIFVGPPGVGKTSLGQSIAKALGRKFARVSLGGVRDDAEIRGHRRTYIGSMPGRIIQAIKRAGENNPVLLLDEIDKMGQSYNGDPGSALLEVLDPEQNQAFVDHYLDVPFDLSKVFFIATANTLESIPRPLLDRLEIIELSGYTTPEKLRIAREHLIPKELTENGLTAEQVQLGDETLLKLINDYTREAGVRELQRKIGALFRQATEKVLAPDARLPIRLEASELDEALGPEPFVHEVASRLSPPGVVTGLAWTPMGGELLFIEAQLMPGTGRLILTGQLGDVMKESAQIALSFVRSRLSALAPSLDFEKKDLHVHVPAGAIPKDGPSAGITMLTAIASLVTERTVDPRTAMTGEITLRGAVTPVGGVKEKVLAAHRAGISRILMSRRNEKDLREIPPEVRAQLTFEFVDTASDVLRLTLNVADPIAPARGPDPSPTPAVA